MGGGAVSSPESNVCDRVKHHTPRCFPSTFNLMSHLCAEGSGGGVIHHLTSWLVDGCWGGRTNDVQCMTQHRLAAENYFVYAEFIQAP